MRLKHNTLIFISGFVWMAVGTFLMSLGIHFILQSLHFPELFKTGYSVVHFFNRYVSHTSHAAIITITLALMAGYIKGKMVLSRTVKRQVARIDSLPNPAPAKHLFTKGYYLLIALMILIGVSLRYLPINIATRGAIDVAIGSALINGAMLYFREIGNRYYAEKKRKASR